MATILTRFIRLAKDTNEYAGRPPVATHQDEGRNGSLPDTAPCLISLRSSVWLLLLLLSL
jgi:hypothetical protein